jgi:hypothetical protein
VIDDADTVTVPMELEQIPPGREVEQIPPGPPSSKGGENTPGAQASSPPLQKGGRGGFGAEAEGDADLPVPAPLPAWRRALEEAVRGNPSGKAGVATLLGVSRVYVSRVMSGHINPVPLRFVERVNANLCRVDCPHLGRSLAPAECRAYAARPYRALAASEVGHWRACQSCPAKAPPESAPTTSFGPDAADRAAARAATRSNQPKPHRPEVNS